MVDGGAVSTKAQDHANRQGPRREGLAVMITNEQIGHKVKLDLRLIESEQLSDPDLRHSWRVG